jgi:hypothetical protein
MSDTTETRPTSGPPEIPAWVNLDLLGGDPEVIEQRTRLGVRGVALIALLAQWWLELAPISEPPDLGIEGEVKDAIDTYLGFDDILRVIFVLTEIHEAMEKRDSDPEWLERWVESRPEIFADTAPEVVLFTINRAVEAVRLAGGTVIMPGAATTAAVSALVPELCAWVAAFVTNPPNRAHPDEQTPADRLAMA